MIAIRKANLNDVKVIVNLWQEFMKNHDKIVTKENSKLKTYVARKETAAENYREFVSGHISSENGAVFLAEVGGVAAGFTLAYIKDEIPVFKIEKIGYVSDLFVKEEFRGIKVSSKLMKSLIKWFKEKGMKHISLGIYSDNKLAHSIYEKWGFFDYRMEMRKEITTPTS